jgi:type IV secretory pathway VirB2 component (pilin)
VLNDTLVPNLFQTPNRSPSQSKCVRPTTLVLALFFLMTLAALAQGSPFDTGFTAIQSLFTGTIANVAILVAIVIGGYGFAHGELGAKKALAGVAAGTGIAVLAVNVLSWLWGVQRLFVALPAIPLPATLKRERHVYRMSYLAAICRKCARTRSLRVSSLKNSVVANKVIERCIGIGGEPVDPRL